MQGTPALLAFVCHECSLCGHACVFAFAHVFLFRLDYAASKGYAVCAVSKATYVAAWHAHRHASVLVAALAEVCFR